MTIVTKILSAFLDQGYRVLKVLRMGDKDVQEADECAPFGIDSNPVKGMDAIYADTLDNGEAVIIGYLNKGQLAAVGETRLYSTDTDGALKAYAWLKADGTIELCGNTDNAVRYTALDQGLQNMATYINQQLALISTGITTAGGAYTAGNVVIDISAAKINEIKTT